MDLSFPTLGCSRNLLSWWVIWDLEWSVVGVWFILGLTSLVGDKGDSLYIFHLW